MGEMNRINGDFSSFIDSLTKDISFSRKIANKRIPSELEKNTKSNNTINLDTKKLSRVIEEKLNKLKEIFKGEVKFEVNDDVNMIIVKIIDKDSKKVIRQIPPETAVKMAEMLDKLEGIFLDERA
ncbi:flagellar protein FlaG [Marinitoga hydrogenitolerans DSM 16785]|uniref:Flagellar protein FlaG n=1 Tax=Marinitoga hydrogenitolerans (strain DSM 16785 / JCM 12826 / AT1271) TaxID=1122195 RepID=A0A1M4S8L0_MARH1|nr:flagellar protein FlaG [Marinitoga hydrogenitolerans]SHE28387.1 flagellar protein FlaG [Marinitoga hydrogenitolerans DSM 16785]